MVRTAGDYAVMCMFCIIFLLTFAILSAIFGIEMINKYYPILALIGLLELGIAMYIMYFIRKESNKQGSQLSKKVYTSSYRTVSAPYSLQDTEFKTVARQEMPEVKMDQLNQCWNCGTEIKDGTEYCEKCGN